MHSQVAKGWKILGFIIPILLAPTLEELGWRGYGVDSLRSPHFNLFISTLLFAALWALWHLPLFFIKGYYHYELRNLNIVYVINFFISILPAAILLNWVYYRNDRSILIVIVAHAVLNIFSIIFKTEQFTKCLVTLLLCAVSTVVVLKDKDFFFKTGLEQLVKNELNLLRHRFKLPGATCAYVLPDGSTGGVATGHADVEEKIPMQLDTRMLAASIGKTFVAATVLQLAKEGRLHLDDPLSHWLGDRPWFSRLPNHATVTLRHLLTHSAGLPDHVHLPAFLEKFSHNWQQPDELFTPESLVAFVLDHPPLFEAGKGWSYTDTGYILLGLVIEKVTHSSYYQELETRFLRPLNLKNTTPSDRPELPHLAAGYIQADNSFGLPCKSLRSKGTLMWNPNMEWTGGGLISSSLDLAQWAKFLYEGGAMKEPYLAELLSGVPIGPEKPHLHYGAGVVISEEVPFGLVYGHRGWIPGYTSSMRYIPQYKFSYTFQVNTDIGFTTFLPAMEHRLGSTILRYISST